MSLKTEIQTLHTPRKFEVISTVVLAVLLSLSAYFLDGARAAATGFMPALAVLQLSQIAGISFKTPRMLMVLVLITGVLFLLGGTLGMELLPPRHSLFR